MATWAKIKFFHDTMLGSAGSTLTATSTATGYDVANLYNMLEVNSWKAANSTNPQYITCDAGSGNTKTADYLAILGHNLGTISAWAVLQNSSDNFASDITPVIAERVTADTMLLSEARLFVNGDFEVWSNGTSVAPDGWTLNTATVSRDTVNYKTGIFGAALTSGAGAGQMYQRISDYTYYRGKTLTFGCWVKCSTPNKAYLSLWDAVNVSNSAYHTGGGGWEFLTVTRTISASATLVQATCELNSAAATAYFDGAVIRVASSAASTDVSDFIQPSSNAKRYWRLKISNVTAAPYMALCVWGNKTELDYATASFDPYEQDVKANVGLSQGGYVTGVHTDYTERSLSLRFEDADSTLYGKIKTWWDVSGLKNFFVAWETANNPNDVYLMRPDEKFSNPLTNGGLYRAVTVNLKGRKE